MSEARAAKVAVVDEVRERFSDSDSLVLTEYRNLDVPAMASLRAVSYTHLRAHETLR